MLQARMRHPIQVLPDAYKALMALAKSTEDKGISKVTQELVNLRASQINGCSVCVDMHSRALKEAGESDQRIYAVAAWRETPFFTEAERAALALAEAATRVADRPDPVSDDVWEEAKRHFDETALSALIVSIAQINVWNRLNATVHAIAGSW